MVKSDGRQRPSQWVAGAAAGGSRVNSLVRKAPGRGGGSAPSVNPYAPPPFGNSTCLIPADPSITV